MFSLIFPGQGSQIVGMGKEFYNKYELVRNLFKETEVKVDSKWQDFKKIINKDNISRKECLLLPFKTISKALKF